MTRKTEKLQLVFCSHTRGQLARSDELQRQPPLGLLVLASYIRQRLPYIIVEVYDAGLLGAEELLDRLDAPVIGFSVWFSNYEESCRLAHEIKKRSPNTAILMGGPHATSNSERILRNQPQIDFVVRGDGEIALTRYLDGASPESIPGFAFRTYASNSLMQIHESRSEQINLNTLPLLDLDLLHPQYRWLSDVGGPGMSAFPISGIRGCQRSKTRCDYCSIPTFGYRTMSPQKYWMQVQSLNREYGINYFFETGDTFSPSLVESLSKHRTLSDIAFRIYSFPGTNKKEHIRYFKSMGISMIYMGIESVLHWTGRGKRRYTSNYSMESLFEEMSLYAESGISLWPGFLLGLPGESRQTLARNLDLIERIVNMPNVHEFTVSIVVPIPGSDYFDKFCLVPRVELEYARAVGRSLLTHDQIAYDILTRIFANTYTTVGFSEILASVYALKQRYGSRCASWMQDELSVPFQGRHAISC